MVGTQTQTLVQGREFAERLQNRNGATLLYYLDRNQGHRDLLSAAAIPPDLMLLFRKENFAHAEYGIQ